MTTEEFNQALEAQNLLSNLTDGIKDDLFRYKKLLAIDCGYRSYIDRVEFLCDGSVEVFCDSDEDGRGSFNVPKEYILSENRAEWLDKAIAVKKSLEDKARAAWVEAEKTRKEARDAAEYKRLTEKFAGLKKPS